MWHGFKYEWQIHIVYKNQFWSPFHEPPLTALCCFITYRWLNGFLWSEFLLLNKASSASVFVLWLLYSSFIFCEKISCFHKVVLDVKLRKKTVSYAACMLCAEKVLFRPGKQRSVIIMLFNSSIRYVICTHFVGKCTISVTSHITIIRFQKRLLRLFLKIINDL